MATDPGIAAFEVVPVAQQPFAVRFYAEAAIWSIKDGQWRRWPCGRRAAGGAFLSA